MFKRKKGGSDSNPSDDHASSSSAIGEGVEFDKFDPEVNKGVFRKRDANELLAALSSGDVSILSLSLFGSLSPLVLYTS